MQKNSYLGVGLGLRKKHFKKVLENNQDVDWYEILSENYMKFGGRPLDVLKSLISKKIPIIPHGVSLSLGSSDDIDQSYFKKLQQLIHLLNPPWFSDHLCFSSHEKVHFHDLLPVLKTSESLEIISHKINTLQEKLKIPFALENISYYLKSHLDEMTEEEFITEIVKRTNCKLLLDVNNVYVNSVNFNFNAIDYIKSLPVESIIQIHLAGHWNRGDLLIDTHGDYICPDVWVLYRKTLEYLERPVSTLIEWDNEIPSFEELKKEARKAKEILKECFDET